jgi:formamidopyrimidine-DNA glycosylase
MPELPEVQTVVNTLGPVVVGRVILRLDLRRADVLVPQELNLAAKLVGRTITSVARRGKRIVIGMTGRLTMEAVTAPLLPHTHLIVGFETSEMRFRDPRRFGGIWWLGTTDPGENMGPEPLTLRVNQLARQLTRTTRAIKNALLDQTVVAGLGNIYVDESLFKAGIHPQAVANELSLLQVAALNRAIKFTLRKALRHRGSTLRDYFDSNGNPGGFQKLHAVYDRADLPCRRCRTPIERIVMGGRSTHFCPRCQRRG